jgi:hypothetical protein
MSTNTKRVLLAAVSLLALLIVGLVIAQTGGGNGDGHPVASVSPSPRASTPEESPSSRSPKEAVREAYLRQWKVYAHAVRTLKARGINEVFTGKALKVVRAEIARRHRTQTPSLVRVRHNFAARIIDPSTAVVDDRYINHSVTIDPKTGKPTERDPNQIVHEVYTMKKVQGLWKVSAIVRQSVSRRKP